MKADKNLIYGLLFSIASVFSLNSNAQDVFGVDYIRKLNVNRNNQSEVVKRDSYSESFFDYDKFSEPFNDELKNSLEGRVMNVYFPTNDCDLSGRDSIDIRRYVLKVLKPYVDNSQDKIVCFNVEGFADCRGDEVDNYHLSHKRAEAVADYLNKLSRNIISPSIRIDISAFGETKSKETKNPFELQKDRIVRIIPNENPIKHALDICDGRIVLGDQSGSMSVNGSPYWRYFQDYKFDVGVDVFSYSEFVPPRGVEKESCDAERYPERFHTYNINEEVAHGATSYYPAKRILISSEFVSDGDTITTVVNGLNDFKGESPDDIINSAKGRKIVLNMIGVELSGEYVKDFIKIANETGGKYYFVKRFYPKTF